MEHEIQFSQKYQKTFKTCWDNLNPCRERVRSIHDVGKLRSLSVCHLSGCVWHIWVQLNVITYYRIYSFLENLIWKNLNATLWFELSSGLLTWNLAFYRVRILSSFFHGWHISRQLPFLFGYRAALLTTTQLYSRLLKSSLKR